MFENTKENAEEDKNAPTELLRQKIRNYALEQREKIRANKSDALRIGLGEIKDKIKELENLTVKDVSGLAGRIKRRKHATEEDMYRLSHAFLQNMDNIIVFANTSGALQVIIKELTGRVSQRQIAALECLCNLSLGEAFVCEKLATMVGSYLVTYAHADDKRMQQTSLWIIANILASAGKGAKLMLQLELIPLLWKFYTKSDDEIVEDAAICLQIIALHHLWSTENQSIIHNQFEIKNPTTKSASYHLQILFHFDILKLPLSEQQIKYLVNFSLGNLCNTKEFKTQKQRLRIIYAIRMLGNLFTFDNVIHLFNEQLMLIWQTNVSNLFTKLFAFKNQFLTKEILWFLRNYMELQQPEQVQNLLKNIHMYKLDEEGDEKNISCENENEMIFEN